jgi:hypothetical protein
MSWSSQIVKAEDRRVTSPRIVIVGLPGCGKTSFAAQMPKPILIDFDKGAHEVKVDRIPPPDSWTTSLALIRQIAADPQGYKTLVIDTMDPLEELAIDHVLEKAGKSALSDFNFADGYNAVSFEWKLLLSELDAVRAKGLYVCLVGHATTKKAMDPSLGQYEVWGSPIGKKCWMITNRWADLVGFACFDSALVQKKGEENRIVVTGERLLYTVRSSGVEAKNRFAMPPKIPLSWKAVEGAIARHQQSVGEIRAKIEKLAAGTEHEQKAKAYVANAGEDLAQLLEVYDSLVTAISTPAAPQVIQAAPAPAAPPPQSAETIELRILALAKGTRHEGGAQSHIQRCAKDIKKLLEVEEALTQGIARDKANAGQAPPAPGSQQQLASVT